MTQYNEFDIKKSRRKQTNNRKSKQYVVKTKSQKIEKEEADKNPMT